MVTSWFFPEQVLDLIVLLRGLANFLIFLNDGFCIFKKERSSLAVQWLRLRASNARGASSIPGWGAKIPRATRRGGPKKKKIWVKCSKDTNFQL